MSPTVPVRLLTTVPSLKIPDAPILLPLGSRKSELSQVVHHFLDDSPNLDFFIRQKLILSSSIGETMEEMGLSSEQVLEIFYEPSRPVPEQKKIVKQKDWISSIDANDSIIVTGSYDESVHVYDFNGKMVGSLTGHKAPVKDVAVSENGTIASVSMDKSLIVARNNSIIFKGLGHENTINSVSFDPSGSRIVTGGFDGSIFVWNSEEETNSTVPMFSIANTQPITMVLWKESGLFSCGLQNYLSIWDANNSIEKSRFSSDEPFLSMDQSYSHNLLASSHSDQILRIWDPNTRNTAMKLKIDVGSCMNSSVSFSPKHHHEITVGSYDGSVKIFDLRNSKELLLLVCSGAKKWFAVKDTGSMLLLGGEDCEMRMIKQ